MGKVKTIVADGNEIFRYGLSSILRQDEFDILSEVDNGALVLTAIESTDAELCILSFRMPVIHGIQLANKLIEKKSAIKILILAHDESDKTLNEFLDSGAHGLLLKTADRIELLDAARKVARGEHYLGKQFSRRMTREYIRLARLKNSRKHITRREREVLNLLVEGLTSINIAEKLFISPRTVDKHRTNLLKKLGQKNTAGLVRYALEEKPDI
jgi:DNA-binding NarL/FixJ family response regulator